MTDRVMNLTCGGTEVTFNTEALSVARIGRRSSPLFMEHRVMLQVMNGTSSLVLCVAVGCLFTISMQVMGQQPAQRLYAGDAPGAEGVENTEYVSDTGRVVDVTVPSITFYPAPAEKFNGYTVLVCPGGAYRHLAINHEGYDVAKYLNSKGFAAAVLKYRVGKQIQNTEDIRRLSVGDGKRAIRMLHAKAEELGIRKNQVGIMGFSAGGSLITRLLATADNGDPNASDPIERENCRPAFAAVIYGSPTELNDQTINEKTPPVFFVHAADDPTVQERVSGLYQQLHAAGIPTELHIFTHGGHGFGLGNRGGAVTAWPDMFTNWVISIWKYRDLFAMDHLKTLGGEAKAELSTGIVVPFKNITGGDEKAIAKAMMTGDSGALQSEASADQKGLKVGYAFCYLQSDSEREVQCYFSSDDAARVWVNGELVATNDSVRALRDRQQAFKVKLHKGLSTVMVKVLQRSSYWTFKFEALAPADGGAVPAAAGEGVNVLREDGQVKNWIGIDFLIEKPVI